MGGGHRHRSGGRRGRAEGRAQAMAFVDFPWESEAGQVNSLGLARRKSFGGT